MAEIERWARLTQRAISYGPLYATVERLMISPQPLDPETVWRFLTDPRNPLLELFLDLWPPPSRRARLLAASLAHEHAVGIHAHYDIPPEMYTLLLDSQRFYSCARFTSDGMSLEEAQQEKCRQLLDMLKLDELCRFGTTVQLLDLASGWGGMLRAVRDYAAAISLPIQQVGIDISPAQAAYLDAQGFRCLQEDYIQRHYPPSTYHRITFIAGLEHVRPTELALLFGKLYDTLTPRGRAVLQFFSLARDPLPTYMVAAQLFFPGSLLARHRDIRAAMQGAGFEIAQDLEYSSDSRQYQRTLRCWFENLVRNREAVLRLRDREGRAIGTALWNYFLVFCAASTRFFDRDVARLHRVALVKR